MTVAVVAMTWSLFWPAATAGDLATVSSVQERLAGEVQRMIDAGHLAPGLCSFEQHYRYDSGQLGWQLDDYWHNPGELVYTLAIAIPHLPADLRELAKAYLRSEFERYPPYEYIHMGPEGARREHFPLPAEFGQEWAER